jgi:glycosyltransferase involved in cell wall biosynthesis
MVKPRLLFLAYSFPPLSAAGSQRAGYLAKYLSRLGWEVTVVTPHPSLWLRTNSPEKTEQLLDQEGIQRITTGLRWPCLDSSYVRFRNQGIRCLMGGICRKIARQLSIEAQAGWPPEIEIACQTLHKGDVDVILATGNPYVSFRSARQLGQRLNVPFVLDYRDPWHGNPHASRPLPLRIVAEERSLLSDCSAATIVSESWALSLKKNFPNVKTVQVVSNGYDPEDLRDIQPHYYGHFAIVYTGIFYYPGRTITPLMKALKRLDSKQNNNVPEWRFHYFGSDSKHVKDDAEHYGVQDRVVLHGQVSRKDALSAVAGADIDVVITSIQEEGSLEERGIVTGKVFEALGLGSRVLLIAPPGSDAEVIVEGTACGRRFSGNQTEEIANYLLEVMAGQYSKPVPPAQYSWPEIVLPLNALLRRIMDEH